MKSSFLLLLCFLTQPLLAAPDVIGKWQLFTSARHGVFLVHSITGRTYIIDAESKTPLATPVDFIENKNGISSKGVNFTPIYKKPHRHGFSSDNRPKNHR